jgi:hypothetical protein
MVKTKVILGDELPYRVEIDDHWHGAAQTPAQAVIAALSVGNLVPRDITHPPQGRGYLPWYYKDVARYLLWSYEYTYGWTRLIKILCNDTFEERLEHGSVHQERNEGKE